MSVRHVRGRRAGRAMGRRRHSSNRTPSRSREGPRVGALRTGRGVDPGIDEVARRNTQVDDAALRDGDSQHEAPRLRRARPRLTRGANRDRRVAIPTAPGPCSPTRTASRSMASRFARRAPAMLEARTDCSLWRFCSADSASRCSSHQASPVMTAIATSIAPTKARWLCDGATLGGAETDLVVRVTDIRREQCARQLWARWETRSSRDSGRRQYGRFSGASRKNSVRPRAEP